MFVNSGAVVVAALSLLGLVDARQQLHERGSRCNGDNLLNRFRDARYSSIARGFCQTYINSVSYSVVTVSTDEAHVAFPVTTYSTAYPTKLLTTIYPQSQYVASTTAILDAPITITDDPAAITEDPAVTFTEDPTFPTDEPTISLVDPTASTEDLFPSLTEDPATSPTDDPTVTYTGEPTATEDPLTATDNPWTFTEEPSASITEDPLATVTDGPTASASDDPATETDDPFTEDPFTEDPTYPTSTVTDPYGTATDDLTATGTDVPYPTVTDEPTYTDEPFPTETEDPFPTTFTDEPTYTVTGDPSTETGDPFPSFTDEPTYTATDEPFPTFTDSPSPTETSTPLYPTALGCYVEGSTGRALRNLVLASDDMTIEFCTATCSPYFAFFGLEFGRECWCDSVIDRTAWLSPDAGLCNMPCAGDPSETCGGRSTINIYGTLPEGSSPPSGPPATTSYTYSGCFAEPAGGRALPQLFASTVMTVELCHADCSLAGYKYAGVEYARECWCGNEVPELVELAQAACSAPCAGAETETCGGSNALQLYTAVEED
ncbi:WSC domain-containing protein [Coniochaeta sp. 2T2.1]|nr:WSC domain-containing protein [Coniochaeta sp. 2T2.1]